MNRKESEAARMGSLRQVGGSPKGRRLAVARVRECAEAPAPVHGGSSTLISGETGGSQEPLPIWLAVLMATSCQARGNGTHHDVRWDCVAGRAVYTNYGRDAERIEPLGVSLLGGETLAVYWTPGETAYTIEVYPEAEKCA
jgi:hypothetical protein